MATIMTWSFLAVDLDESTGDIGIETMPEITTYFWSPSLKKKYRYVLYIYFTEKKFPWSIMYFELSFSISNFTEKDIFQIIVCFFREIENYSTFIYSITYMYSTHIFSREVVEGQFDIPSLSVRKNLSSPDGLWILISCTKTSGMERCANICLLMLISFLDESTEYSKQVTSCISPWT